MLINPKEYIELEAIFQLELQKPYVMVPKENLEGIQHYLIHAEIEMAFEIFGLLIIAHELYPPDESVDILLDLGLRLNLDKESVYDPHFWSNFTDYLNTFSFG